MHVVETAPAFNIALAEPKAIKLAFLRAEECAAVVAIVIVGEEVATALAFAPTGEAVHAFVIESVKETAPALYFVLTEEAMTALVVVLVAEAV